MKVLKTRHSIALTLPLILVANIVFAQVSSREAAEHNKVRLIQRIVETKSMQSCPYALTISRDDRRDQKKGKILEIKISRTTSAVGYSGVNSVKVTLSQYSTMSPSGIALDNKYSAFLDPMETISSSSVDELKKAGNVSFRIDLSKIKWERSISSAYYQMPPDELEDGTYVLTVTLEFKADGKDPDNCTVSSNQLSISKMELVRITTN
jgi:hypothetical protein